MLNDVMKDLQASLDKGIDAFKRDLTKVRTGRANLAILEREDLCARALELETRLPEALAPLARNELVDEVRGGAGVLAAVQLSREALAEDAALPGRLVAACRANGVLTRALASGALQISPALVIGADELAELAGGIGAALDAV